MVCGIGSGSCPDVNNWDIGVADDPAASLSPTHSVLQTTTQVQDDLTNKIGDTADPGFAATYDVDVNILASRTYPAFRQAVIVAQLLPPTLMGNYHLKAASAGAPVSPAYGLGAASTDVNWGTYRAPTRNQPNGSWTGWTYTVTAPRRDIDGQPRPGSPPHGYDAGSDQLAP
jgi:hypothetical protein